MTSPSSPGSPAFRTPNPPPGRTTRRKRDRHHRKRPSGSQVLIVVAILAVVGTGAGFAALASTSESGEADRRPAAGPAPDLEPAGAAPSRQPPAGPVRGDFMDISKAPGAEAAPPKAGSASAGTFTTHCGRNEKGHRNSDNFITAPGVGNGAHHMHDYVGNRSTDGFSTDESLLKAGTTCDNGDKSTYFWPVLRIRGDNDTPDPEGNTGTILTPEKVELAFRGNAQGPVTAMPKFLRVVTGDAKAFTNGRANARARWTCTGFEDRRLTERYPLCPAGSGVVRVLDFPSCWDGQNTDSPNHRAHVRFPESGGACPAGTKAVPQLRMKLTYNVPQGRLFALDTFPEQLHKPGTDHGDFVNVMPRKLMEGAVDCINEGRSCG